jgi:hypothetical protein
MGAIVTNLLYFAISFGLVAAVGRALSRSGRAFTREMFGGQEGVAEAVNRLLIVAFYLLSVGFIALTMPVWVHVGSAGHALQLLSGKIGELLLVLGALHLASTAVFARLRRGRTWPPRSGSPASGSPRSGFPADGSPRSGFPADGSPRSGFPAYGSPRPPTGAAGPADDVADVADVADADASPRAVTPALWRPRPRHVVH